MGKLLDLVREYSQTRVAAAVGVSQAAVGFWCTGKAVPSPKIAARLIVASGGRLTWEDLYGHLEQREAANTRPLL